MTAPTAIRAVSLSKWYGEVTALSDVSFEIGSGAWGLVGPNGSGKTTLMRAITGQLMPSLGELRVSGEAPFGNPRVLSRMGVCPEADALYETLTGLEHVSSLVRLSGFSAADAERKAVDILSRLGLSDAQHRRVSEYSRGMRQRVKIAQALAHDPEILILDEPLTGTDPISRSAILDEVKRRADHGALVLFSSHVLPEIEALTDRVIVLARGRLAALGSVSEIRDALDEIPQIIRVDCSEPRRLGELLATRAEIVALRFPEPGAIEVETSAPDATYDAVAKLLATLPGELTAITSPDANVEALLSHLTARVDNPAQSHRKPKARP